MVPHPARLLRLLGFAVPAALAAAAAQPLLAASVGAVPLDWALGLSVPCLLAAALLLVAARLGDVGALRPPWYTAWLLLPGAFLLAGAASMCIFGALIQLPGLARACWSLLLAGFLAWTAALALVRRTSS